MTMKQIMRIYPKKSMHRAAEADFVTENRIAGAEGIVDKKQDGCFR